MRTRLDVSMSRAEVEAFLEPPRNAVLTTNGRDGYPHSVAMWFVPAQTELLMWTYRKSQKARNASRDPRCCFLVESGIAYSELKGVLVRGDLEWVDDVERVEEIGTLLYERYTFSETGVPVESGPKVEIRRQAQKRVGLILPLVDIASWDHAKMGSS